jgi:hypothetical protein
MENFFIKKTIKKFSNFQGNCFFFSLWKIYDPLYDEEKIATDFINSKELEIDGLPKKKKKLSKTGSSLFGCNNKEMKSHPISDNQDNVILENLGAQY